MTKEPLAIIRANEAIEALQLARKVINLAAQGLYRADAAFDDTDYGAYFGNELHKISRILNAECGELQQLAEELSTNEAE